MPSLIIRPVTPDDFPAIRALAEQTKELQDIVTDYHYYDDVYLTRATESSTCVFIVAEENSALVGFVMAKMMLDLREVYLEDIAVVPGERSRGVGKALLLACLEQLRNNHIEEVWLLVHEDNARMQSIMGHYGFTLGRKFHYVRGRLDQLKAGS